MSGSTEEVKVKAKNPTTCVYVWCLAEILKHLLDLAVSMQLSQCKGGGGK